MPRHAYLILAHRQPEQLKLLVSLLDDPRNDIFIHWDAKSPALNRREIACAALRSGVFFTKRVRVRWGGFSCVEAELILLRESRSRGPYCYYHLLSGADLPLKTQEEIHGFFERRAGCEFLGLDPEAERWRDRIRFYRLSAEGGVVYGPVSALRRALDKGLVCLQRLLGVDRLRGERMEIAKGSQWMSITDGCAELVLSRETWIRRRFRLTAVPDEMFLQMLVWNSPLRERVFQAGLGEGGLPSCLRRIDWRRGAPHIWREEDLPALLASPCMFARKFDPDADRAVIRGICAALAAKGGENRASP